MFAAYFCSGFAFHGLVLDLYFQTDPLLSPASLLLLAAVEASMALTPSLTALPEERTFGKMKKQFQTDAD